eukprot:3153520-Rhodomonas_salina.3
MNIPVPASCHRHTLCQPRLLSPGTRSKWLRVSQARVARHGYVSLGSRLSLGMAKGLSGSCGSAWLYVPRKRASS